MIRLTDVLLSAYIDGELDPEEAAKVALALTRDPDAVRRLEELRKADALLREAFDWSLPADGPLKERVAAHLAAAPPRPRNGPRIALMAASLAVAALGGFSLGELHAPRDLRMDPRLGALADGGLAKALDTQKSDDSRPVRIALSFRAQDGRLCRQFATEGNLEGLACRAGGRWRLVALGAGQGTGGGTGYRAAAGSDGPVDRAVELVGVGEILDLDQEAELIGSGWRLKAAAGAGAAMPAPGQFRSPGSPR